MLMRDAIISFPMLGDFSVCPSATYTLFGRTFYWYGAIIACAFIVAVFYGLRVSKRFGVEENDVIDVLILAMPMAIIGCRLYFVIVNFDQYRYNLLDIFKIWEGGLAMYGGLLFAGLSVLFMCRRKKISWLAFMDMACLGILIGQILGRWANFINREAYGVQTDIFCRMGLTLGESTIYVHPLFLYEMLWNLVGFVLLHLFIGRRKYDGQISIMYVLWYGIIRTINDGIREEALFFLNTGVRSSQVIGAATAIAALVLLLVLSRRPHPPEKLWVNLRAQKIAPDSENSMDKSSDKA